MTIPVTLIRHAESTFNAYGDMSCNVPLTENGKKTCSHINFDVDLVVCSTMRRARETLDHSNIKYKRVIFTPLCREKLDGNPVNLYNGEKPIVETDKDLENRIQQFKDFLQNVSQVGEDKTICVISHYEFLRKTTGYVFKNANWMGFDM